MLTVEWSWAVLFVLKFIHESMLPAYRSVLLVSLEARRVCWIPWAWSYRWLWVTVWVPGIEPASSARVVRSKDRPSLSEEFYQELAQICTLYFLARVFPLLTVPSYSPACSLSIVYIQSVRPHHAAFLWLSEQRASFLYLSTTQKVWYERKMKMRSFLQKSLREFCKGRSYLVNPN